MTKYDKKRCIIFIGVQRPKNYLGALKKKGRQVHNSSILADLDINIYRQTAWFPCPLGSWQHHTLGMVMRTLSNSKKKTQTSFVYLFLFLFLRLLLHLVKEIFLLLDQLAVFSPQALKAVE